MVHASFSPHSAHGLRGPVIGGCVLQGESWSRGGRSACRFWLVFPDQYRSEQRFGNAPAIQARSVLRTVSFSGRVREPSARPRDGDALCEIGVFDLPGRQLQRLGLVIGVAVLVLTQSKTTWTAAAITVPLLVVLRSRAWGPAAFSLLALGVLVSLALLLLPPLGVSFEDVLETKQGHGAATLDGRDVIWGLALQEWLHNPLFGYGVTMWNDAYRMQIGLDHAVSAHNQFLQSLSVSGGMGLLGLLVYLGALSRCAISARRASRGLSVALLIVVL